MSERRPDPEEPHHGFEDQLRRAAGRIRGRLPEMLQELDDATATVQDLLERSGPERRDLVQSERVRVHGLALCNLLEEESRKAWFTDPASAVELADLAVEVANRLDVDHYGNALVEDTRALAWAYLGHACQVESDLRAAEELLRRAEDHYQRGDRDELTAAQILSFRASLRNAQGRFSEAAELLDQAILIYRDANDRHREGRTLIQKATALGYAGKFRQAEHLIRRGLSRISLLKEPQLAMMASHNLIWYLTEDSRFEEARIALEETRGLYLGLAERMNLVRLRWLEGRIALGLGHLDEAEAALQDARDGFIEHGIGFDAAFVSLHLAGVYAKKGNTVEMKRLAAEIVPIFQSRDLYPETLAALAIFCQAD